jgi:hypothetical protein
MLPFETKSFDPASGEFVGLASTPQVDRSREVVSVEAMREAAARYMENPVVTDHHGGAIGRGLEVQVNDQGTMLKGYITDKTQQGRDVRGLLEDRILRSLSIGFNPYSRSYGAHPDGTPDYAVEYGKDAQGEPIDRGSDGVLVWKRIDWMETAICAIPCNPGATIALAKSFGLTMESPLPGSNEEREEARFLSDVDRVRTGAVSIGNIARHWKKSGRDLSPEQLERLTAATNELLALLETNPVALVGEALPVPNGDGGEGKDTGPCVLRLPDKLHLTLRP